MRFNVSYESIVTNACGGGHDRALREEPAMIDLHTHLHPPRLMRAIRRWFAERSDWKLDFQPAEPHDVAAVLRAHGIERFVFCSYAHKPGMATELNRWLADTSRALDGFGLPLATVHPDDPDPVGDLRAALDDGCVGLKLHEDVQQVPVDDIRLAPVFAELAARGCFLLVHVGPIPWSFPRGAGPVRVERVLRRHPALRVVVAHFGLPDSKAYGTLMAAHPHLYLDTTMAFAPGSPMNALPDLDVVAANPNRIVFGSDFPNIPYAYGTERETLGTLGLPARTLAGIFGENAARVLAARAPV